MALLAAVVITTWQSIEARRQRDIAIYQQLRVQAANEFLTFLFDEVGPQGGPLTLSEPLDRGVSLLDRQYGDNQRFTGTMYYDLAMRYAGLGENDRTLELLARAESIARAEADTEILAAALCATARNELLSSSPGVGPTHLFEIIVLSRKYRPIPGLNAAILVPNRVVRYRLSRCGSPAFAVGCRISANGLVSASKWAD